MAASDTFKISDDVRDVLARSTNQLTLGMSDSREQTGIFHASAAPSDMLD